MSDLTALAKTAEAYETPRWAVEAILDAELLTRRVVDPCCGKGVLGDVARSHGHDVVETDKHDWAGGFLHTTHDFLTDNYPHNVLLGRSVLMNPPFSLAVEFVERCFDGGARKIVCFQRFAWWESAGRKDFWEKRPPNRVYICGNRASCWRFDIPEDQRKSGTTTAHAWFVWERGQPAGTVLGHIYKDAP